MDMVMKPDLDMVTGNSSFLAGCHICACTAMEMFFMITVHGNCCAWQLAGF